MMLLATGLFRVPSASSRSLTFGHRLGSFNKLFGRRSDVRALLDVLSTPELLLLAAGGEDSRGGGRRSSNKQELEQFLRRLSKSKPNMRDSVDDLDLKSPVLVPRGLNLAGKELTLQEMKTLHEHGSSLLEHPYVEKSGLNDFLVIEPGLYDAFSRYVPNDIYYNGKTCVNWLDGCNAKGMREKLLTVVNSP